MSHHFYAHTLGGRPPSEWQPLEKHLAAVAKLAERSAAKFQYGDWAWNAGWLHDLGKAADEFQAYLLDDWEYDVNGHGRVNNSSAGAAFVRFWFLLHRLSLLSSTSPLRIIPQAIRRKAHQHACGESYRMPDCGMGIRLNLAPYPPLSSIFQVIELMADDKPLHTAPEVFSHINLLFVGQGKPESGI